MENYKFLFKPLFFIFSLVFAGWMVLKIETVSPSDFGKYRSLFEVTPPAEAGDEKKKVVLEKICDDYRCGKTDSATFMTQLRIYFKLASKNKPEAK
jgi:hypothetical protein